MVYFLLAGTVRRFLEKFSDVELVVFVVENADEVRVVIDVCMALEEHSQQIFFLWFWLGKLVEIVTQCYIICQRGSSLLMHCVKESASWAMWKNLAAFYFTLIFCCRNIQWCRFQWVPFCVTWDGITGGGWVGEASNGEMRGRKKELD